MHLTRGVAATLLVGGFVLAACAKGPGAAGSGAPFAADDNAVKGPDSGAASSDGGSPWVVVDGGGASADAGTEPVDAGRVDAGDAGIRDAGQAGPVEAGQMDAGRMDASAGNDAAVQPDPCDKICNDDKTPDARSCASAVTVGRRAALGDAFIFNGDTRKSSNRQELALTDCPDGSADNFFRIFLYKDDVVTAYLTASEHDPVLKLVTGPTCEEPELAACVDENVLGVSERLAVMASVDGWHYLVADGPFLPGDPDGEGRYTLSVSLESTNQASFCSCR